MTSLMVFAAESAGEKSTHAPYFAGGVALVILFALLLALLAFGKGREHS